MIFFTSGISRSLLMMASLSVLNALARRSMKAFIIAAGISEASGRLGFWFLSKKGLSSSTIFSMVALVCLMTSFMRSMLISGMMVPLIHSRIWSMVTVGVASSVVVVLASSASTAKAATPRERTMTRARRRLTIFFIFLQPFLILINF